MYPLFETLAVIDGKPQNMALHQARYERSLRQFYGKSAVNIVDLFSLIDPPPALRQQRLRCRIDYYRHGTQIRYMPHVPKTYRRFCPVVCNDINYGLKFADRRRLDALFAERGDADEIIIIKQGRVTDCSIGNLVFKYQHQWLTPDKPLLNGTQRQALLQQNRIVEAAIFADDLPKFSEIRLINALNPLLDDV